MKWKPRVTALLAGFLVGVLIVFVFSVVANFFRKEKTFVKVSKQTETNCDAGFKSIDEIIAALKSEDVSVRRDIRKKLFVRPSVQTNYYDFKRDNEYPERAENLSTQFVQLDKDESKEAIIRFVRLEHPVAIVLKEDSCGWNVFAVFSAWLRFEEYPYGDWLELHETVECGVYEILLRESTGDATSYFRKARLLKLIDGNFKQIAEIEEENIQPLENYKGADWSDVKQRSQNIPSFENIGRIKIKSTKDEIKHNGASETYLFFSEMDGSWHTARRHWRTRSYELLKKNSATNKELIWNNQRADFQTEK